MDLESQKNLIFIVSPLNIRRKTILKKLRKKIEFHKVVLTTTRPKRPQEIEGKDYHFVSWKQFGELTENDKLATSFKNKGNHYGVTENELKAAIESGLPIIWNANLERALKVKKRLPNIKIIFITIPLKTIGEELAKIGIISQNVINLKIIKAKEETDKAIRKADLVIDSKENQLEEVMEELVMTIQKF